tara:strand:+ start:258 stop:1283 length:1026 start_codon:yes stop_codon:yes gene_type:complete
MAKNLIKKLNKLKKNPIEYSLYVLKFIINKIFIVLKTPRVSFLLFQARFVERYLGIDLFFVSPRRLIIHFIERFYFKSSKGQKFSEYGNYFLKKNLVPKNPVVYSGGIGKNISFDLTFFKLHKGLLRLFDPTKSSIVNMAKYKKNKKIQIINPGDSNLRRGAIIDKKKFLNINKELSYKKRKIATGKTVFLNKKIKFYHFALYYKNKKVKLFEDNTNRISSASIKNVFHFDKKNFFVANAYNIPTLKSSFKDKSIDILKLDVEGVSENLILNCFENNIYPRQIVSAFEVPLNYIEFYKFVKNFISFIKILKTNYTIYNIRNRGIGIEMEILAIKNEQRKRK